MKTLFVLSVLLVFVNPRLFGQAKAEPAIRKLEQVEVEAIQKADTTTLLTLWSKRFVVNNPYDVVVTVPDIMEFIRAGQTDYSSVERLIERITFTDNIAISMGKEILRPQQSTPNAGKVITTRYTHIWMKEVDKWRLVARQATNFSVE